MKVVISLTTIPSRFDKLGHILKDLVEQTCHEVWVNIPRRYTRFPEWDGHVPDYLWSISPKVVLNTECEDFGPGTKFIAPARKLLPDDLIIYVDDDTHYDTHLAKNLLKWHLTDTRSAWGLSGFKFEDYFKDHFPRQHGAPLDVLEGYGAVIVKAKWIQDALPEFKELLDVTWHDDMLLCNLLEKAGVTRKTVFTPECNISHIRQFDFGFGHDALHVVAGPGGHKENNMKILKDLELKGKLYYKYTVPSC